jgi:hypothetical protein
VPQTTAAPALPPGPRLSAFQQLVYRPGAGNPLPFFTNLARTYGDVVTYRMAGEQVFLVSDPHLIKDILVTHNRNFIKGRGLQRAKRLLGEGLLTSEGPHHLSPAAPHATGLSSRSHRRLRQHDGDVRRSGNTHGLLSISRPVLPTTLAGRVFWEAGSIGRHGYATARQAHA